MKQLHIKIEDETMEGLREWFPDRGELSVLCRRLLEAVLDHLDTGLEIDRKGIAKAVVDDAKRRGVLR